MRPILTLIAALFIVLGWYSWFFRYQPVQNGLFLDRWHGDAVNVQGMVVNLEDYRQTVFARQALADSGEADSRRARTPFNGRDAQKAPVTPEQHLERIRQMLQEGQGLPGQDPK